MFLFFLTNWRQIIVALISFGIGVWLGYGIGLFFGEREGRAELKAEVTTKTLEVREKHAKIRNSNPDRATLTKRLYDGTY